MYSSAESDVMFRDLQTINKIRDNMLWSINNIIAENSTFRTKILDLKVTDVLKVSIIALCELHSEFLDLLS